MQEEKEIYLLRDINRNLLDNQIKRVWSDYNFIMEPLGLTQFISEPTRETSDSQIPN